MPAGSSSPRASSTCSGSRSSRSSSTTAPPARSPRASRPRSPARAPSIAPLDDRMAEAARPRYEHFGLSLDFRTLGGYFERLETRVHPALNVGSFVGAGGLRDLVVGRENRPATAGELARMQALVEAAMREGALGVSSSLQYVPDGYATTDELVALAAVAARFGGIYLTHQRSESGADRRLARRGGGDRRAREDPGGDLAPQDRLRPQLRPHARRAPADRRHARTRARRDGEHVPVHAGLERARRLPAAVGARGRRGRDGRPAQGSGDARAHQAGDGSTRPPQGGRTSGWARAAPTA